VLRVLEGREERIGEGRPSRSCHTKKVGPPRPPGATTLLGHWEDEEKMGWGFCGVQDGEPKKRELEEGDDNSIISCPASSRRRDFFTFGGFEIRSGGVRSSFIFLGVLSKPGHTESTHYGGGRGSG